MTTDWFASRTYRADNFDIADLAARKADDGTTVSVVLPAFNESATIAGVIHACAELSGQLVDEIVVTDGGSTDDTTTVAAEAGATVYGPDQLLPDHGPMLGKGDALWRSLSVTTGDIVVFVDTDIRNPDPRFVWALLGPLLTEPTVDLVKAYYERPIEVGGQLQPSGGGRVTELMARPLLNLFWPELAGIIQPLSGEYAVRRDLLTELPFFTGYGVEIGMLIDTLESRGINAMAQVDLSTRIHRNQTLDALSRMASGILHVAADRLRSSGRATIAEGLPTAYTQFTRDDNGTSPEQHDIKIVERRPFSEL